MPLRKIIQFCFGLTYFFLPALRWTHRTHTHTLAGTQQTDFSVVNRLLPPVGYRSETTSNTIGSEKDTTATEQQAHYYPFMPSQGWPSQGWDCSPYYQHSNYTAFWQHQQPYASVFNSSQTFPDPTVPKQHEVGTAAPPPAPPPPPPPPPYHYHIEPYFNNPATFNNHATFNSHASSYPTTPVDTTSPVSSQQHLSPVYVRQQEATSSREDSEQLSQALGMWLWYVTCMCNNTIWVCSFVFARVLHQN